MATPKKDFPPVRACLFDMDGLLLDSEDKYSICTNAVLAKYNKPALPWSIKAQLQGRPGPQAGEIFHKWAKLPITREEFLLEQTAHQKVHFPDCAPLPGVTSLLSTLSNAHSGDSNTPVHIALATSSHASNFALKTTHLTTLFSVFTPERRVLGDDPRIAPGRGKPAPDIYLLALDTINQSLAPGEKPVTPEECLVFEDSVPGVESGRRAGMRCIWVPHAGLLEEYKERQKDVLAGRTGEGGNLKEDGEVGEVDDGWAERLESLENFPYERYGIVV